MAKNAPQTKPKLDEEVDVAVVQNLSDDLQELKADSVQAPYTKSETAYSISDLSMAAATSKIFGDKISPDIVAAALQLNGLEAATVSEASKLINNLMKKEVE